MGINVGQILAAVGLLVFGIYLLEKALYFLVGHKLKHILQKYTGPMYFAVPLGMISTILFGGSGDLVVLLTMVFVTTGILTFRSGLGIIFGTNIGATSLPLLVAFFGFTHIDFMSIVLPTIAIGGVLLIVNSKESYEYIAKLLLGFGLLFLAIEWMQGSIGNLEQGIDISQYTDLPLWGFGILGAILVSIMQSGGAIGIMTLTALQQKIITFPASIAIMLGVNLGTTNTPFLGSLGGDRRKLQIAVSHVGFNIVNVLLGSIFFRQLIALGDFVLGIEQQPELTSAMINMTINMISAVLFSLGVGWYQRLIEYLIPLKQTEPQFIVDQLLPQQKTYGVTMTVAYTNDVQKFLQQTTVNLQTFLSTVVTPSSQADADMAHKRKMKYAMDQAKHLLNVGVEIARTSRSIEHQQEIAHAKYVLRQCYQIHQLLQETKHSLHKGYIDDPSISQQIIEQYHSIALQLQYAVINPQQPVLEEFLEMFNEIKTARNDILQSILVYLQDNEPSHNNEKTTHLILAHEHIYRIVLKTYTVVSYYTLSDNEFTQIEKTIFS